MRVVADASVLVAEALTRRGRILLAHPNLELFATGEAWEETRHEVERRINLLAQDQRLPEERLDALLTSTRRRLEQGVVVDSSTVYQRMLPEALRRIPRDPSDAPTVALALATNRDIWTNDHDFFGCGVPVWTTETLFLHLETGDTQ